MKPKIILFGAGNYGKKAFKKYNKDYEIICFADNNKCKVDTKLFGKIIIPADSMKEYLNGEVDVVVCAEKYLPMCQQLEEMGIDKCYVDIDGDLFIKNKRENEVKRCSVCVMDDTSDKYILFNEKGECNYCIRAFKNKSKMYFPNIEGKIKLNNLLNEVRLSGRNLKYDCVMGISGGLDSSYLLYLGKKWGLRILAVHIDDGYDTDISKANIKKLINKTGVDYEVITPDGVQYNDLILSYMKAGVPNLAAPQDNILLAFLYKKIRDYGIKYFLSGGNFALESILQKGNTHNNLDVANIMDIHNRFGSKGIDKLEFISENQMKADNENYGIISSRPLNYIEYNRDRAFDELREFCDYEYYGRKHLENVLTAFLQLYWLPIKFGVDKRTSHLSSMIVSNQMTRERALVELQEPLYDGNMMKDYISVLCEKLGINSKEFENIMKAPIKEHEDYAVE